MPVMEEVQKEKTPLEDPPEAEPRLKGVRVWGGVKIVVLLALVGGTATAATRVVETGIMAVVVGIFMIRAQAARRMDHQAVSMQMYKEPMQVLPLYLCLLLVVQLDSSAAQKCFIKILRTIATRALLVRSPRHILSRAYAILVGLGIILRLNALRVLQENIRVL